MRIHTLQLRLEKDDFDNIQPEDKIFGHTVFFNYGERCHGIMFGRDNRTYFFIESFDNPLDWGWCMLDCRLGKVNYTEWWIVRGGVKANIAFENAIVEVIFPKP